MEAKELMIGDWVKFTSKYGNGTGQVVGIEPREGSAEPTTFTICEKDKEGNTKWFVGVRKNWVEPIPITPEILRKNGFGKWGKNFIYEKDGLYMQIKLGEFARIFREMNSSLAFNRDFYVHTLQHALRLCGIDKEIEL